MSLRCLKLSLKKTPEVPAVKSALLGSPAVMTLVLLSLLASSAATLDLDVRCDGCSTVHGYAYPRSEVHADWDCDDCHCLDGLALLRRRGQAQQLHLLGDGAARR